MKKSRFAALFVFWATALLALTACGPEIVKSGLMIKQDADIADNKPFSMIIASDLHFGNEKSTYEKDVDAIFANWDHVLAMNDSMDTECSTDPKGEWPDGGSIAPPAGVILNGDLANRWQIPYAKFYKQFYEPEYKQFFAPYMGKFDDDSSCRSYSCAPDNECCSICNEMIGRDCPSVETVNYTVFPGYGNHDYVQNVQSNKGTGYARNIWECGTPADPDRGTPADPDQCAENAINYMKKVIHGLAVNETITNFQYDPDSLAYSFDYGSYHFVQLQFRPDYSNESSGIGCSMDFLQKNLQDNASGKRVIVNMHEYSGSMTCGGKDFKNVIKNKNVAAVFSGHTHGAGFQGNITLDSGEEIPRFLSGSIAKNEFLLVGFSNESMKVGVVKSTGGNPSFKCCRDGCSGTTSKDFYIINFR